MMNLWGKLLSFAYLSNGLPSQQPLGSPNPNLDPYDHSWVKAWASIGDSYASGLGTGPRVDYSCSRYAGGYANLIEADSRFGSNPNRTFQYLACSGELSTGILSKQVHALHDDSLDVLTVSAGGNDVALGDVLDACIFQWRHGNTLRCETALNRSQVLIDTILAPNIDNLLEAAIKKLSPQGTIYYPGYAQFFGASDSCNNLSWSVWPRMPPADRQNLTQERRARMNDMVHQVNIQLRDAVARAGPRVVFIDWDWTFTQANGRFCEVEVADEPAPDRRELLFFEWNTLDDGEDDGLLIRPGDPVPSDTFEGSIGKWVLETMDAHPDWATYFGPDDGSGQVIDLRAMRSAVSGRQHEFKASLGFDDAVFWFLPDSWKRVFHPRALGQHIIADMVLHEMDVQRGKALGVDVPEEFALVKDDDDDDDDDTPPFRLGP